MLDILFFTQHNFVGSALCAYLTVDRFTPIGVVLLVHDGLKGIFP